MCACDNNWRCYSYVPMFLVVDYGGCIIETKQKKEHLTIIFTSELH